MIIDKQSGKLYLPSLVISPEWTRDEFEQSELREVSVEWMRPRPNQAVYKLPVEPIDAYWLHCILYFFVDRLGLVELVLATGPPAAQPWDDWSQEDEMR